MIFDSIVKALGPKAGMAGLTVKNYSPELYLAGAVGAAVASAVMLAKAHKKSDEVFDEVFGDIHAIREYIGKANADEVSEADAEEFEDILPVTVTDAQKMLAPLYLKAARQALLLYGPAVMMGLASVGLVLASHNVLRDRNRALMGALTLFERGFALYRGRVVDELGVEADERFYYGAEQRKITTLTKDKDGKSKKKKSTENHIPETPSPMIYSRVFDETNRVWQQADPDVADDLNEYYLNAVQSQMNDRLYLQGYVLLNTVYAALGFADSPEGAVVGWSKNVPGDNYISFGINNDINRRPGDNRWILDFNVNGVVFETIGEE